MRRGHAGALALVLLVLASACLGAQARPRGGPVTVVPTTFARPTETVLHEGPGELVGRVLDDEYRPLPESLVEVFRRRNDLVFQLALKTDAEGVFAVRGMSAGEYVVYVSKPGYFPHKPEIVYVEDGKTTRADWFLVPGPARDPFHTTKSSSFSTSAAVCTMANGQPLPSCLTTANTYLYPVDEINNTLLMSLVMEARWSPSSAACPGSLRTDVYAPDQASPYNTEAARAASNPNHWDNLPHATSPTKVFIPRFGDATAMMSPERTDLNGGRNITTHGRWTVYASTYARSQLGLAVDYSCFAFQTVALATTFWHGTPAPGANWTYFR